MEALAAHGEPILVGQAMVVRADAAAAGTLVKLPQATSVELLVAHHESTWLSQKGKGLELLNIVGTSEGNGPFPYLTQHLHHGV